MYLSVMRDFEKKMTLKVFSEKIKITYETAYKYIRVAALIASFPVLLVSTINHTDLERFLKDIYSWEHASKLRDSVVVKNYKECATFEGKTIVHVGDFNDMQMNAEELLDYMQPTMSDTIEKACSV